MGSLNGSKRGHKRRVWVFSACAKVFFGGAGIVNQLVESENEFFVVSVIKALELMVHDISQSAGDDAHQVLAFRAQLYLTQSFILLRAHSVDQPLHFKPLNGAGQCARIQFQGFGQVQQARGANGVQLVNDHPLCIRQVKTLQCFVGLPDNALKGFFHQKAQALVFNIGGA